MKEFKVGESVKLVKSSECMEGTIEYISAVGDDTIVVVSAASVTEINTEVVDWSKVEAGTLVAVSDDATSLHTAPLRRFVGIFNGYILVESPIDQSPLGYKYGRVL